MENHTKPLPAPEKIPNRIGLIVEQEGVRE